MADRRALLRGNLLWLSLISLLNDAASEMIFPLLPYFLVGVLGAGPAFLGLIEGVAEMTASLVKLWGGWVSDRIRRRKLLVGWGYGVATVARPLIAATVAPWQVLALRFADRVGKGVRTAPRDALLADSVPAARRGFAFGFHRGADHAGAMIGPLIATGVLLLLPGRLRVVFALAAVPGVLSLLVLLRVRERAGGEVLAADRARGDTAAAPGHGAAAEPGRPGMPDTPAAPVRASAVAPPRAPLRQALSIGPTFSRYLLVIFLFTLGNASDAFLLLRAQDLGVPLALVPVLWAAFHASKMLWSVPGGLLADRFGAGRAIGVGWLLYAAVYAGFAVATEAWHAWALFAVYGLFFGLTEAPEKALVARLAPADRRATAFGLFHFAVGIAALPASLLFGVLWELTGAQAAFGLGAALALASAALLPWALRRRTET